MSAPLPSTIHNQESLKAFVQDGFSSWAKALEQFRSHQKSNLHRAVAGVLATTDSLAHLRQNPLTCLKWGETQIEQLHELQLNSVKKSKCFLMIGILFLILESNGLYLGFTFSNPQFIFFKHSGCT